MCPQECFERLKASCEEHVPILCSLARHANGMSRGTDLSWMDSGGGSLDR